MSEDSVKVHGVLQVVVFLIIGAVYIALLYVVASNLHGGIMDNSVLVSLTRAMTDALKKYDHNHAKIMVSCVLIFLSVITGMLISDLVKKFTIVSPFLLFIVTIIDLVPIKLVVDGF